MKDLGEQSVRVKFCFKLGKKIFTETLLNEAYGEECTNRTQLYEWFKHFKEGTVSVGMTFRGICVYIFLTVSCC